MPVAFVDGVAAAHVAAADRGKPGERYLVADAHLSTRELAAAVLTAQGGGKKVPGVAPAGVLKVLASTMAPLARAFGFTPLVAPGELSFLLWDVSVDSTKAQRELGFEPTPPAVGIPRAVEAFRGR
jgi:nucleoside-diphosphate-sugar epimerase